MSRQRALELLSHGKPELAKMLEQRGLLVERQKPIPIRCQSIELDEGFRLDLLVDGQLINVVSSCLRVHQPGSQP